MKKQLYLFVFLLVVSIVCFWYASGKFFTENYYYPKATFLLPVLIICMAAGVFAQIRIINRKEPIVILDGNGIQYLWVKLPLVRWNDISSVEERFFNNEKQLTVSVKDINAYIGQISSPRLKEKYRKRLDKTGSSVAFSIELKQLNYNMEEFENIVRKMIAESAGN